MKEGRKEDKMNHSRAQELCQKRGGRLGLPVTNKSCGFCGRSMKEENKERQRIAPEGPNKSYGFCGP